MKMTIYNLYSMLSTILLISLLGNVHILNAVEYCRYYNGNGPQIRLELCPNVCCTNSQQRTENKTCCDPPTVYISTSTVFGCSWRTFFLCAICIFFGIAILVHFTKRIHILKHAKHFNSVVDPVPVFTISKDDVKPNLDDHTIVLEDNPPSYSSPASPPPYESSNPATIKILE